ncbi:conserved protein, partial [Tepidicaulis marinus]
LTQPSPPRGRGGRGLGAFIPSPLRGEGGTRCRRQWEGEGSASQLVRNLLQHAADISKHLMVPETDNAKAARQKKMRARLVARALERVLPAIQLDNEPGFKTDEIGNKASNRKLPAELCPRQLTAAQMPPKQALGIRQITAQRPRFCRPVSFHSSQSLISSATV